MTHPMRTIFSLLIGLWCGSAVAADLDHGPLYRGVPLVPRKVSTTRLVSMEVTFQLFQEKAAFECVFQLVNEGRDETVEMGFPTHYPDTLEDLQVHVNGERVDLERYEKPRLDPLAGLGRRDGLIHWSGFTADITEGATVQVRALYTVAVEPRPLVAVLPGGSRLMSPAWRHLEEKELELKLAGAATGFLVHPASRWPGKVDRVTVVVKVGDITADHLRAVLPREGVTAVPGGWQWTWLATEPSGDVFVEFRPSLTLQEEIDTFEGLSKPGLCKFDTDYVWRPFHLASLYLFRDAQDDRKRASELMDQVLDRFLPPQVVRPLRLNTQTWPAVVGAVTVAWDLMADDPKDRQALLARVRPFLQALSDGDGVLTAGEREVARFEHGSGVATRAAQLLKQLASGAR